MSGWQGYAFGRIPNPAPEDPPRRYVVICPDHRIRHHPAGFTSRDSAAVWADQGHICLAAPDHTIVLVGDPDQSAADSAAILATLADRPIVGRILDPDEGPPECLNCGSNLVGCGDPRFCSESCHRAWRATERADQAWVDRYGFKPQSMIDREARQADH